ncbi:amino acid ABC transporter ATP-binding protein [Planctomicrobium sp. SH668]|uniref:amino acid ABC transporter ATP-binding protein n=1 Tax=Planctomicrobium sp. SH668 TaxID=3448126 RepID=UPI003F5AF94A
MISLKNIVKRYDHVEVLSGVSLTVSKGEVCVLLGPSGGGKSTLLRTINGLETFDSGEIQVDEILLPAGTGRVHDAAVDKIRLRVGMVFQQFNLFPHRTVIENVTEAPVYVLGKGVEESREQAKKLLDRVGLLDKCDVYPSSLSGGQQQRVAIARALAMKPEVILFDEPTSALDPRMTAEVTSVMADLAKSGQTMIIVTHAMGFARKVANQVHILHAGTVAESGPPEQIFNSPQTSVTKEFLMEAKEA